MKRTYPRWQQGGVLECDKCQRVGHPLASSESLQCIKVSAVWELVGIDLTGPLPKTKDGFEYILTATDYFYKWVEAFPLRTKTAAEVGLHICSIIYRHGCPKRILSDQGRECVNQLNTSLCEMLGIERRETAAYHPQTNGLDEKTTSSCKFISQAVLFSLRSKIHTSTKQTPFMLMYGREPVFPSEVPVDMPLSTIILQDDDNKFDEVVEEKLKSMENVNSKAADNIANSQESQRQAYAKRVLKKYEKTSYNVGDEVLLFNMKKRGRKGGRIEPDFSGPYVITHIGGKLVSLSNFKGAPLKSSSKAIPKGARQPPVRNHRIPFMIAHNPRPQLKTVPWQTFLDLLSSTLPRG
ncbi:uncharacterized protein LOC125780607 [Scomber scombrus]|uniref:Uncharacterized protein LOC125780607 n=1 Tax=Scomber scombrus TaxID=13677 RepID=A0AAV1Q3F9_SCOSC